MTSPDRVPGSGTTKNEQTFMPSSACRLLVLLRRLLLPTRKVLLQAKRRLRRGFGNEHFAKRRPQRSDDELDETDLVLGKRGRLLPVEDHHWLHSTFFFSVALCEKLLGHPAGPLLVLVMWPQGMHEVRHVKNAFLKDQLVDVLDVAVGIELRLEVLHHLAVERHVGRQNHGDYPGTQRGYWRTRKIVIQQIHAEIIHHLEPCRGREIFKDRLVIVSQRERAACLDQIIIAHSRVRHVVDGGGKKQNHEVDLPEDVLTFDMRGDASPQIVSRERDVRCVDAIMVRILLVPGLDGSYELFHLFGRRPENHTETSALPNVHERGNQGMPATFFHLKDIHAVPCADVKCLIAFFLRVVEHMARLASPMPDDQVFHRDFADDPLEVLEPPGPLRVHA
mmetsp:Transcript_90189/g.254415  ORF Transcript_90189/g.254415 Transcript_90189/m.254415 type:complete len:393 (+) Transcript_90189:139-1317(+)